MKLLRKSPVPPMSANLYVNRNMVGAVVLASVPFGGEGAVRHWPKAGGPLYLYRLLALPPPAQCALNIDADSLPGCALPGRCAA